MHRTNFRALHIEHHAALGAYHQGALHGTPIGWPWRSSRAFRDRPVSHGTGTLRATACLYAGWIRSFQAQSLAGLNHVAHEDHFDSITRRAGKAQGLGNGGPAQGRCFRFSKMGGRRQAVTADRSRGKTSKVDVALAQRRPSRSVSVASAKAARRPIERMRPSARTGPLVSVSGR